jgi:stage III sporulation protein AC
VEKSWGFRWSFDRYFNVLTVKSEADVGCEKTMAVDIDMIFQIAGIGIIIAMIHTVLKQMGKEDMAHWVTLIGFVVVLFMVIRLLDDLFREIKTIFLFQ